jgi:hypothetical protein
MHTSTGILRYSENPYKLIVEVDPEIVRYYRALVPKWISLNRQKHAAHISVVRKEIPVNLQFWRKYEGQKIDFMYDGVVCWGKVYYWLCAYSDAITNVRLELGLTPTTVLSRPPDGKECFHITIGNLKSVKLSMPAD